MVKLLSLRIFAAVAAARNVLWSRKNKLKDVLEKNIYLLFL
jgi:hypothetical protein